MSILFNFEVGVLHPAISVISLSPAVAALVVMSCPGLNTGFVMVVDLVARIPCRLGFTENNC
jgi:hypothetical protein